MLSNLIFLVNGPKNTKCHAARYIIYHWAFLIETQWCRQCLQISHLSRVFSDSHNKAHFR